MLQAGKGAGYDAGKVFNSNNGENLNYLSENGCSNTPAGEKAELSRRVSTSFRPNQERGKRRANCVLRTQSSITPDPRGLRAYRKADTQEFLANMRVTFASQGCQESFDSWA
jgi:hypothetical protein